ncbi:MAG: hypothetical protein AB1426_12790 [Bacillota bacterium]
MQGIGITELFLVLVPWLLVTGGFIVLLVAVWRLMRAHEALVAVLKEIAGNLKKGPDDGR